METQALTKEEMRHISVGIAAEMSTSDTAEYVGTNGKQGDARIDIYQIEPKGVFVARTNGAPVWWEDDASVWDELIKSEGIVMNRYVTTSEEFVKAADKVFAQHQQFLGTR